LGYSRGGLTATGPLADWPLFDVIDDEFFYLLS
jgi:hypothetical protein